MTESESEHTHLATFDAGGVEISYRSRGRREDPAVTLMHGFTGNVRNFNFNFNAIGDAGFRVLASDHPGHGRSGAPDDPSFYQMPALARIQRDLAEHTGFTPTVLVGHSMGAAVAEEFAIAYPEQVRALVLVDSAGGSYKESWRKTLEIYCEDEPRRVAFDHGMKALFDYQIERGWRQLDHLPEEIQILARDEFARTSAVGYFHAAGGLISRRSTLDALRSFDKPALVVHGENEDRGFVKGSQELAAALPNARLKVVAGAGHSPPFEAPLAFNELLISFLNGLD